MNSSGILSKTALRICASKLKAWLAVSRLPFHTVGVFPFVLGAVMASQEATSVNWAILGWGIGAVVLIMLATYYSGEYFDYEADCLASQFGKGKFSGGSQVLQAGTIPKGHVFKAAIVCLLLAGVVGVLLQFYYHTGPFTILLGACGMFAGFFYAAKPLQWAHRGIGEILIGFSYGWLPVAAAFYILTGEISSMVHWVALPIALTIFNVILINEFPDYEADKVVGKKNLVVRFGKEKMGILYILTGIATIPGYALSLAAGAPIAAALLFLPFLFILTITLVQVARGDYADLEKLDGICTRTMIVNLGTTQSFVLGFGFW